MKKVFFVILISSLCLWMVGCGNSMSSFDESTLIIGKDGAITDVIVESFDKDYYTEQGLTTFFNETISNFSVNHPESAVKLSGILVEDGIARAKLNFNSADTYKEFYDTELFFGTISDAYDNGYDMDVTLKSTNSDKTINKNEIMEMAKNTIVIVDDKLCIKTPGNVKFASANVEVINGKSVRISSDSSGLAYLILD